MPLQKVSQKIFEQKCFDCFPFCNTVQRWILSRTFKRDINNDYGIYPENGDDVVMEAVDRNTEYEQQAAGRQVSENEYDKMYDNDKM